jgi:hypothetical protein
MVSTLASRTRRRYFRVPQRQISATGCKNFNKPHAQITTTTMYNELYHAVIRKLLFPSLLVAMRRTLSYFR